MHMAVQVLRLANASDQTSKRNAMIGEVVGYRLKKLQAISGDDKVGSPPMYFHYVHLDPAFYTQKGGSCDPCRSRMRRQPS